MTSRILNHLLDSYGGFADRRVKIPKPERLIRIDDSSHEDRSPDFCRMFVSVDEQDRIHLALINLPTDDDVHKCLTRLGAKLLNRPDGNRVELVLTSDWGPHLKRLANLVYRVVDRGRRYSNRNWKWAAPRAASSLERLAEVLHAFDLPMAGQGRPN